MSDADEKSAPERAAEDLKREAKARGATGARVTLAERRLRDTAIIAALHAGQTVRDVAADFELTTRQVHRISREHKAAPTELEGHPMELVEDLVRDYRRAVADFEAMAFEYRDASPSAALRAKRGAVDTREKLQMLLTVTGKLPQDLALLRSEAALERLFEQGMGVLQRVASGGLPAGEALRELDRIRGVDVRPYEIGPGDVHDV